MAKKKPTKSISICGIHSGQNIQDNYYIKIDNNLIHVENVSINKLLLVLNNAINDNLEFVARNFTITKAVPMKHKCMFCDRMKSVYFIQGNADENKKFIICKKHMIKFSDHLQNLYKNGNCFLISTKPFQP